MMRSERRQFVGGLAATLAAGLFGCRSEVSEAPAGEGAGAGEAKRGPSEPSEQGSMRAHDIERIDFVSTGGHAMARVGELELREWTSWLRIRADTKRAELALTRHSGDLVDRPVGRFGDAVDDAALLRLHDAIAAIDWDALPEPLIGDPTANMLTLELVLRGRAIKREFSASAQAFMTAIWPVLEQLNAIMGMQLAAPIAALQVEALLEDFTDDRQYVQFVRMRLRNVGRDAIVIAEPREAPASLGPRARWMLAAKPANDMQMPVWSPVELSRPPKAVSHHVIEPGGVLDIPTTLLPSGPGTYLLQAIWNDYAGPSEPPADALAFMPLPATGEPASGPYLVRGAAFSRYVEFSV